jgi:hypothetical protein
VSRETALHDGEGRCLIDSLQLDIHRVTMTGRGKKTIVLTRAGEEPELMAAMCWAICISIDELLETL